MEEVKLIRPTGEALTDLLEEPISTLGMAVRTTNALDCMNLVTVGDLLRCCGKSAPCTECANSPKTCGCTIRLMSIPNFGEKTLKEVYRALERVGLVRPTHHKAAKRRARREAEEGEKKLKRRQQFPRSYGQR